MSESLTNEHGVEIFTRRIFRWDEVDTVHWDDDGLDAQIVTGEHMHLIRAAYAPGSTYEMHSHPHEQFSLLLSGRIRLTVGEESREIGPGDGWYAPAGVPHGGEILGEGGGGVYRRLLPGNALDPGGIGDRQGDPLTPLVGSDASKPQLGLM